MSLREFPSTFCRLKGRSSRLRALAFFGNCRYNSTESISIPASIPNSPPPLPIEPADLEDLESQSTFHTSEPVDETVKAFNPIERAKRRTKELPPSRYQYRPPRYYRGPLHPHQPPPASDPHSRTFVPGPFYNPRMQQTYQSTVAADLMTLLYKHQPPGTVKPPKADRLRTWDDSSPYHKNRPKRGPRGPSGTLRLIEPDINWRNIPKIEAITIHTMTKKAMEDSAYLHVGGMVLQAVTGVKPTVHESKHKANGFGLRGGTPISLTCHLRGDQAVEFLDKCIHLVMPQIKDWSGVEGTTGDWSGNLSFGFSPEGVILFPEMQVNYDMYPPHMIPGFHAIVHTTAKSDRHARLLLKAMGVPFTGKLVD